MFRTGIAITALAAFAPVGSAQPRQLPLSPGVMPGSPWGPGAPFVSPVPPPPPRVGQMTTGGFRGGRQFGGVVPAYNSSGYGFYSPGYGFGGFGGYGGFYDYGLYGGYGNLPQTQYVPALPAIIEPARPNEPNIVLAQEFPATLTLQFPAAADVWLDGKKVTGEASEERVVKSPVLKTGEAYTFLVKAQWTKNGKTYEAKRTVSLGSGDRSRLFIVSGEEVKE